MRQRLGIAAALLGDPPVLMFDEPVNGLDPEGIRWIRELMRSLAAEGRTVLVSSHLMSEMALTADHLIVIGRGRLIADTDVAGFLRRAAGGRAGALAGRRPAGARCWPPVAPASGRRPAARSPSPGSPPPTSAAGRRARHPGARADRATAVAGGGVPDDHRGRRRVPDRAGGWTAGRAVTGIPRGVLAAEWIKLRSVRSTWVLLGCALVLGVGDAVLSTSSVAQAWPTMSARDRLAFDPVGAALDGLSFGVLAFGTFGALASPPSTAPG